MANKYFIGFMILVVLSASIYVVLPDNIRIDVGKTYTTFKVYENGSWVLAGTERTILFDGTKKMRAWYRDVNYSIEENKTKIVRTAKFKDNITAIDTYLFDGSTKDVELYPIEHTVEILNGQGKLFVYEVNDLEYFGETISNINSPQSFGHNMKVEWEEGNYYSKIYKYLYKNIGKLTIKYRIKEDYENYSVRLFDPASGGTITTDGAYKVHTFTSNGTLEVTGTIEGAELLIVGGGGGSYNGGGGAGGYVSNASVNLTAGSYTVIVGVGGLSAGAFPVGQGQNSSFDTTIAGGGGRGAETAANGYDGGSGGGGGLAGGTYGGAGIVGQGNDGGGYGGTSAPEYPTGAGGGCGAVGGNGTATATGNGGDGCQNDIYNGTNLWYAGGGAGGTDGNATNGTAGKGGGGATGLNGTANTGGGSGGRYLGHPSGGFGGSGIVIVRYSLDIISPTYSDNQSNNTEYGQITNFAINVTDETTLHPNGGYIFSTNNSGEWVNDSEVNFTKTPSWANVTKILNSTPETIIGYRWYFTDNSLKANSTPIYTLTSKDTTIPLISYEEETKANATSLFNVSWIYANVSVTEDFEKNITYLISYVNGTVYNSSAYTTPRREINWTNMPYGVFLYNVTVFDDYNNSNSTETRTIYVNDIFLFLDLSENNMSIELNTTVNVTGNTSTGFGMICLDIDHPDYGTNYTCSNQEITLNFTINYFRKTNLWDLLTTKLFNFTGGFQVDDENLTIESHQYDEVDDLRFNISSTNNAENVVFYRTNTTTFDRAYQGFLVGPNIYLNQSVNSAGDTFRDYENLTYSNPGNKTIYFYLDDNATIQNITINVTGKDYGFSYFDSFTNFSNIDESLTDAQLHYGPGGFIQAPNSSLVLRTFDNFDDASIANHWTYDGSASGSGYAYGVRETGGYLEAYTDLDIGVDASITRAFYPNATNLWFYTSDYLSFDIDTDYNGLEDGASNGCTNTNTVKFADVNAWTSGHINSAGGETEESTSDVSFEMTKVNNTHWEINVSGTETQTTVFATDCDGNGNVIRILNYTNGTTDTDWADVDCPDTSTTLSNSSFMAVDTSKVIMEFVTTIGDTDDCNGLDSYLRLDNLKNKMWNRTNGSIVSNSIFDSSSDITSSTFNLSGYNGVNYGNYSFYMWLSADNGVHWESVTNGIEHTFIYPGKNIKWKTDFNTTTPGYHNATSYIENVTVATPINSTSNIEFDFGNDGIWDYKLNGTFNETNTSLVISMPNADISNAFTSRRALYDHTYQIPLRIYSASAGQLNLDIFNVTYNPNPIILNYSSIQTFLDAYGSNETNFSIAIGGYNGSVNVSDIKFDYAGGNSTIAITIRNLLNTINVTRYIYPYYSRWDYMFVPLYVDWLEFIPNSPTSLNVTPYGQSNTTAILNITNYGYGDKNTNLSVYLNETSSCVNLTLSTTWDKEKGYQLNSTWIELDSEINYLSSNDIYMWADYNCTGSTWGLFNPYMLFRQCCSNCSCDSGVN